MIKMRSTVLKHIILAAVIMAALLITFSVIIQVLREQEFIRNSTKSVFDQVEHLLNENSAELEEIKADYSDECLKNAETIAYIIENDPTVLDDINSLRRVAEFTNVDEIHLFNEQGVIFNGTHPEYYGLCVDDGEQIGLFKQMLNDKSLKLVQELTPNTGKGDMIQYSAVWSSSGRFFVQVGMTQENVIKVTEKNQLSYIFSLLKVNSDIDLYAAQKDDGKIIGSTSKESTGKALDEIGISFTDAVSAPLGFHTRIDGKWNFCIFEEREGILLGRVVSFNEMYHSVITTALLLAVGTVAAAAVLVIVINGFISKKVINGIEGINADLVEISSGNLDKKVDNRSCAEFSELSDHINSMIASLIAGTETMSNVLSRTELQIGVYEYNEHMKTVRFTEKLARILLLEASEVKRLSADCILFKEYIRALINDKVSEEENIYRLFGETERYVKFEEFAAHNSMLGFIMDVTEEYKRRMRLEEERDADSLTGLLNRNGLDRRLSALFGKPEKLRCGALVMIDADGLKQINDSLGHDAGDIYLKSIADALRSFGEENTVCSRQGGDEFVLFLYGFESGEKVEEQLQKLTEIQDTRTAKLNDSSTVPISFSFGVSMLDGSGDYMALLKAADDKMYESKRQRKQVQKDGNTEPQNTADNV